MEDIEGSRSMPILVRKLIIHAAADGLILQPLDQRAQRVVPNLYIRYTTQGTRILRSETSSALANTASLEAYGIVGCRPLIAKRHVPH